MEIKWYFYIFAFFAGVFLVNSMPHFLNGISGNYFPTPFAKPPGKGLSSPIINVLWGFLNFIIGFLFFYFGKIFTGKIYLILVFFSGAFLMALRLASVLVNKLKE
jgi:hypothetical protein